MKRVAASLIAVCVLLGCQDMTEPTNLNVLPAPSFQKKAVSFCPAAPDWVVATEDELEAAVLSASAGDVIAIDGIIEVDEWTPNSEGGLSGILVNPNDLTLTCAAPGAALVALPPPLTEPLQNSLLFAEGGTLRIEHLELRSDVDFAQADGVAHWNGDELIIENSVLEFPGFWSAVFTRFTDAVRVSGNEIVGRVVPNASGGAVTVSNNHVECAVGYSTYPCLFVPGGGPVTVHDNDFVRIDPAMIGAVWIQGVTDARLTQNRISTDIEGPWIGIRVFGSPRTALLDNVIDGPFGLGMRLSRVDDSLVDRNRIDATVEWGIVLEESNSNLIRHNDVRGAGIGGVLLGGNAAYGANCLNVLQGNQLNHNGELAAGFTVETGANTFVGSGKLVVDDGQLDCDGDGVIDPNRITGKGPMKGGVKLGQIIREMDGLPLPQRGN